MNTYLFTILSINFIASLGFSIVLPLLLVIVQKFGGNAFMYGVIAGIYPLFQAIGSTILGQLSDTFGRKKVLVISQITNALAWTVFFSAFFLPRTALFTIDHAFLGGNLIITVPLIVLFISRAVEGFSGGSIAVVQAYISDVSSGKEKNTHFGYLSISSILGFIIGPALAALLGSLGWGEQLPIGLTIGIACLGALFVYFFLHDIPAQSRHISSIASDIRKEHRMGYKQPLQQEESIQILLQKEHVLRSLTIYFFLYVAFNIFIIAFPLFSFDVYEWNTQELGIFFSAVAILLVLFQAFVLPPLSRVLSEKKLIIIGSVLLGSGNLLLLTSFSASLYITIILFSCGVALIWPSVLSLLSHYAGRHNQGTAQGVAGMAASMAGVFGLFGGGYLYEHLNSGIFVISGLLIYTIIIIALLYPKKKMYKTQTAGGVVLNNQEEVLVVNQNNNSWSLPKGHIDPGEDAITTAKREIYEESGISSLTLIRPLGLYERYRIGLDGKDDTSELKEIQMFLFTTDQKELKPIDKANPEARWVQKDKVSSLLTHRKDKEFFEKNSHITYASARSSTPATDTQQKKTKDFS